MSNKSVTLITDEAWKAFHDKHGKDAHPDFILVPRAIMEEITKGYDHFTNIHEGELLETDPEKYVRRSALVIVTDSVKEVTLVIK